MENSISDQRKHKRYAAPDGAVAACNKTVCRITDISEGGMALNCIGNEPFSGEDNPTILCRKKGFFIGDLPIRLVRKTSEALIPLSAFRIETVGVIFDYKNAAQRNQIRAYIAGLS